MFLREMRVNESQRKFVERAISQLQCPICSSTSRWHTKWLTKESNEFQFYELTCTRCGHCTARPERYGLKIVNLFSRLVVKRVIPTLRCYPNITEA